MEEFDKRGLTIDDIAYMLDPSALKLDTSFRDIVEMTEACKKFPFGCCFSWPCYYDRLPGLLKGTKTLFGVSLGFPSGQEPTSFKVFQARQFMEYRPAEVDMVMNIGLLKSKNYQEAIEDICAVKNEIGSTSLKVIIESMLLNDEEIETACKIVMEAGADYVKTGTGFSVNNPTTIHEVVTIMKIVQGRLKVKVAGGVRDLSTLLKMHELGVSRFGVGYKSALSIMNEAVEVISSHHANGQPKGR